VTPSDRSILSEPNGGGAFSRSTAASSVGSMSSNSVQSVSRSRSTRGVEHPALPRSMLDPTSPTRPEGSRRRRFQAFEPNSPRVASSPEEAAPAVSRLGGFSGSWNNQGPAPRVYRESRVRRRPLAPSGDMDGLEQQTPQLEIADRGPALPRARLFHDIAPEDQPAGDPIDAASINPLDGIFAESQREFQEAEEVAGEEVNEDLPSGGEQFAPYSQKLIAAHRRSLHDLVKTALDLPNMPCDNWVVKRKQSASFKYENFLAYLVVMMAGMESLVLKHFVEGDLPLAAVENPELARRLRKLKNLSKDVKCPAIYAQYFVNRQGKSPSVRTLLSILDHAERYAKTVGSKDEESVDYACAIDSAYGGNWTRQKSREGQRRYLANGESHAEVCFNWIKIVRARLRGFSPDEPVSRPLLVVGYATIPFNRLLEHETHRSSNYLMNLLEAISRTHFNGRYSMKQYVVLHIVHATHAMYSEIMITRIGLGYVSQGGGMSHFPAGVSHPGINHMPPEYFPDKQKALFDSKEFKESFEAERQAHLNVAKLLESATKQDEMLKQLHQAFGMLESAEDLGKDLKKHMEECINGMDILTQLMDLAAEP